MRVGRGTLDFWGSVHSGLQVDAITYPWTTVVTASSPWLNGRPKPITISIPNFRSKLPRRQSDNNLHLITQNI